MAVSSKDIGMLWHHQLSKRIMGSCGLKVPYILWISKDRTTRAACKVVLYLLEAHLKIFGVVVL